MKKRGSIAFERTRDTEQRIHELCACLWVPCSSRLSVLASCAYGCAFTRWNFLLHTAKKNNNAVKCFVFQVKLVIRKASLAHHKSVRWISADVNTMFLKQGTHIHQTMIRLPPCCPWLPLPAWYGCARAWATDQAVAWWMCAPCFKFALF